MALVAADDWNGGHKPGIPLLRIVDLGRRRIALVGEIDISNADELTNVLKGTIASDGDLTLDLRDLVFIDCSGIRVLAGVANALEGRGRLQLLWPSRMVNRVFAMVEISRLPNVEVIPDTVSFRGNRPALVVLKRMISLKKGPRSPGAG